MSVRMRRWRTVEGFWRSKWVCDFTDHAGVRRLKTFAIRDDAEQFATLQIKGPAATAIAPDRGSTNPTKDQKMNTTTDNTGPAENPGPDIGDLETPIMDARRMASILSRLLSDVFGAAPSRGDDFYRVSNCQSEDILFAAFHTEALLVTAFKKWESLL